MPTYEEIRDLARRRVASLAGAIARRNAEIAKIKAAMDAAPRDHYGELLYPDAWDYGVGAIKEAIRERNDLTAAWDAWLAIAEWAEQEVEDDIGGPGQSSPGGRIFNRLRDLFSGGGGGRSSGGGRTIASGSSASSSPSASSNSGYGSTTSSMPTRAEADVDPSGAGSATHGSFTYPTEGGTVSAIWTGGTPNPVGEVVSLSRDPFMAGLQWQALGFAGRFIPPPTGPVEAFGPDFGVARDGGGTGGPVNWEMFDPIAPVAEIYEGRAPRPSSGGQRTRFDNPYIEALYPEGSGRDDEDDPLAAIAVISGRPMPAPEIPGEPAAAMRFGAKVVAVAGVAGGPAPSGRTTGAVLVAYSAGVTSPTIEFDGAGRVRRVTR